MKKFMLLYLAPQPAEEHMSADPEEMKKTMEPWMAWKEKYGDAIVDFGVPLGKGANVGKGGGSDRKTQVGGYSIIQAENIDAAKALVVDHPFLMGEGASVEVLEMMPVPGM